ncbi:MAG: hypothetical protein WDZ76_06095 [Pseudohongiellaceae bacterium]
MHRYRGIVLLIALLTTVSGQVFAYPRICAMPGMDRHDMALNANATSMDGMVRESSLLQSAADSGPGEVNTLLNCEQICGYCLSFNFSHAETQLGAPEQHPSSCFTYQPVFYLSAHPDGLYRPPIPA